MQNANYSPEPRLCSFVPAQFETSLLERFPTRTLQMVVRTALALLNAEMACTRSWRSLFMQESSKAVVTIKFPTVYKKAIVPGVSDLPKFN